MGSGSVKTAISAQTILSRYRCNLLISTGPVGTLNDSLKVGQWGVIGKIIAFQKGAFTEKGFQISEKAITKYDLTENPFYFLNQLDDLPVLAVASGEAFVCSDYFRIELNSLTGATCVDMNLFGLQSCLANHRLLSLHLRIVSDKANRNAVNDFQFFSDNYNGAGGKIVAKIITNFPADKTSPESYPKLNALLEKELPKNHK